MSDAIKTLSSAPDYTNAHGTSTPVGDIAELEAIKSLFGSEQIKISSTKSMTGHSLGATGAQEAIYSLIMMKNNFIAPSININELVDEAAGLNVVTETINQTLNTVMSNSFGFGGTNACLVFSKY